MTHHPIIGAHADWHPNDYRFPRCTSDGIAPQKSRPIVSLGRRIFEGVGLVIAISIAMWAIGHVGAVLALGTGQ